MRNELKISTLSIVCVLCASVAMPSFGASSVRALGGAGTYTSASGAAAAKSDGGAINSVRAGSMRVNNVAGVNTGATRSGSTRAASTPRLSIGKYLSGSSAISGGSSISGANKPGAGSSGNDLRERVEELESFVGFSENGESVSEQLDAIKLDVDALAADLSQITGGATTVEYADGVLTVVQGEDVMVYDLATDFAGMTEIDALQEALDGFQDKYYTKEETDALLGDYAKKDDVAPIVEETVNLVVEETVSEALLDYEIPDDSVGADKLNFSGAAEAVGENGFLMLQKNAEGKMEWVDVLVD
ncbi:MAG: hypothetical protein J6S12_04675 [Alphaproteobacteria bacterium]|nr:hypothetical protein [Alphaproteobacteria bacterium]